MENRWKWKFGKLLLETLGIWFDNLVLVKVGVYLNDYYYG